MSRASRIPAELLAQHGEDVSTFSRVLLSTDEIILHIWFRRAFLSPDWAGQSSSGCTVGLLGMFTVSRWIQYHSQESPYTDGHVSHCELGCAGPQVSSGNSASGRKGCVGYSKLHLCRGYEVYLLLSMNTGAQKALHYSELTATLRSADPLLWTPL